MYKNIEIKMITLYVTFIYYCIINLKIKENKILKSLKNLPFYCLILVPSTIYFIEKYYTVKLYYL